jgi:hypothetical protein
MRPGLGVRADERFRFARRIIVGRKKSSSRCNRSAIGRTIRMHTRRAAVPKKLAILRAYERGIGI